MKKSLIIALFTFHLIGVAQSPFIKINQRASFTKIIELAEKSNKPILLWLSFNEAYPLSRDAIKGFDPIFYIPVYIGDYSACETFVIEHNLSLQPSLVFLAPNGFILHYLDHIPEDESEIKQHDAIFKFRLKNFPKWVSDYKEDKLAPKNWVSYLKSLEYNQPLDFEATIKKLRLSLPDHSLNDTLFWSFFYNYNLSIENSIVKTYLNNPIAFNADSIEFPHKKYVRNIVNYNLSYAASFKDTSLLRFLLEISTNTLPHHQDSILPFDIQLKYSFETEDFSRVKKINQDLMANPEFDWWETWYFNFIIQGSYDAQSIAEKWLEAGKEKNPNELGFEILKAHHLVYFGNYVLGKKQLEQIEKQPLTSSQKEKVDVLKDVLKKGERNQLLNSFGF